MEWVADTFCCSHPSFALALRRRRLTDGIAAAQHIEAHIGDDHPADDPEHIERYAENAQDLELYFAFL
jgi:hypothetical protein